MQGDDVGGNREGKARGVGLRVLESTWSVMGLGNVTRLSEREWVSTAVDMVKSSGQGQVEVVISMLAEKKKQSCRSKHEGECLRNFTGLNSENPVCR